jgi:hypothetical protein
MARNDPEDWNAHIGGDQGRQFLIDLWDTAHPLNPFPYAAGDPAWTTGVPSDNAYGVFWWNSGRGDLQWRLNWSNIEGTHGYRILGGVVADRNPLATWTSIFPPAAGAIRPDGMAYDVVDADELRDYLYVGRSCVLGLGGVDTDGGLALRLIPVGLDTFYTSWFDESTHRLEAFGAADKFGCGRLRVLPTGLGGWRAGDLIGPYPATGLVDILYNAGKSRKRHLGDFYAPGTVRFQLRNLTTNEVSPLSDSEIYVRPRERWWPYQVFVRTRKR